MKVYTLYFISLIRKKNHVYIIGIHYITQCTYQACLCISLIQMFSFAFSAAYPSVIPDISIRSCSLSDGHNLELRNSLTAKAKELVGSPMIQKLMHQAEELLKSYGLQPGKSKQVDAHKLITEKEKSKDHPKRKGRKKKVPKSEDEKEEEKKKSMKTADDVIKRILWDEGLDRDEFLVGYIDRFRGLLEKYFSAFSWEDIATVDYDVLAVPHHRIQYFKYKSVKVWDKPHRIDNVFGSAKGTKTIDIVIKELEELEGKNLNNGETSSLQDSAGRDEETLSSTEDSCEDSDDEDDIVVTIGASANIGFSNTNKYDATEKPKKEEKAESDDEVIGEDLDSYNPYWRDKLRPNYFICFRVTDPTILDAVDEVQDHIMDIEPILGECCIPLGSLHVTLCTVGLDTPDQLVNCMTVLEKLKSDLQLVLPKYALKFHGVSNFYNRVVYAKIQYEDDFIDFCNELKFGLLESGIEIRDGYEFVPHMTLMKTTRPVSRIRKSKNIRQNLYEKFVEKSFGEQKLESINLCSMSSERREDGFYLSPVQLDFK